MEKLAPETKQGSDKSLRLIRDMGVTHNFGSKKTASGGSN